MSSISSCLITFFDHFCILDFPVLPGPHWMSLASGSRPCFSTKASSLAPGLVCLSLPPWFLTQFLPLDHRVLDLPPLSAIRHLAAVGSLSPWSGDRQDRIPQRSLF
ncbi:hypothetical protein ATANTOWER_004666 [Ataeniobius toweri]|uniref:Uncharacterized protein n=1 Tax=Ataeniobius toweri TaxID=208326 RepID=A0ABU7BMA6_9TELE|nr:hypothetical protein [Ataeniobius toweri]